MPDYIVVGGGSAGCVLAARLSEDPRNDVLLLEEGPDDKSIAIHLPILVYKTATGKLLNRYEQEPWQDAVRSRPPTMVQARVLGGGSSVNAMLYVRGTPADYDRWAEVGAEGWSYDDVLPYFKKSEDNATLSGDAHGSGGPLLISSPEYVSPLSRVWLKACQEAGIPRVADFNAGIQSGSGLYQMTLRDGRRSSAATCFLKPARKRSNLRVETNAKVQGILTDGKCAVGVEYIKNNRSISVRAEREVVLTAGAINTPRLMLLSGIGPASHLKDIGVPVVHDLPGVGQNLQDHMDVYLVYKLSGPYGLDPYKRFHMKAWAGLQYALFRQGPVCSNVIEAGAFWHANRTDPSADVQFAFLAGSGVEEGVQPVNSGFGCTLNTCFTRPRSRGWVGLRSPDPDESPRIVPNYLSDPYDLDSMARGVEMGQKIMQQKALAPYLSGLHMPDRPLKTMDDFRDHVREVAQGALHPVGTCRIGSDGMAVVDSQLRVHGMSGLRVADMAVFPFIPSGNTNAGAIMLGERAADLILLGRNTL